MKFFVVALVLLLSSTVFAQDMISESVASDAFDEIMTRPGYQGDLGVHITFGNGFYANKAENHPAGSIGLEYFYLNSMSLLVDLSNAHHFNTQQTGIFLGGAYQFFDEGKSTPFVVLQLGRKHIVGDSVRLNASLIRAGFGGRYFPGEHWSLGMKYSLDHTFDENYSNGDSSNFKDNARVGQLDFEVSYFF